MTIPRLIAFAVAAALFVLGCVLSVVSARMSLDRARNGSRAHDDVRALRWVVVVAFGAVLGVAILS